MNKRTIIIFSVVAILIIVGVSLFFIQTNSSQKDPERKSGLLGTLFPFNFGVESPIGNNDDTLNNGIDNRPVPRLRMVSESPTAGGFLYDNSSGTTTMRFVERGTGHVFEASTENLTLTRVSNTTIPGIQEVVWKNTNNFIIRYLEDNVIQNFYAQLVEDQAEQTLTGFFVDSWDRAILDPQKETLFSITETSNGSVGIISDADGTGEKTVFTSALRSWIPLQSEGSLYVQTAPASGIPGFLYEIQNGSLIRTIGDVPGLQSVVSPTGKYVLFSGGPGGIILSILNTETGEIFEAPLTTIATKCAFISESPVQVFCGVPQTYPAGSYPNDWLLGRSHFSDDLWLLEPIEGVATLLSVPGDEVGATIDVWQPAVSAAGAYASFINKNDLSFWLFKMEKEL